MVVRADERPQKIPCSVGVRRFLFESDVAAPKRGRADLIFEQGPDQQRLRIMHDKNVVRFDQRSKLMRVVAANRFVQSLLIGAGGNAGGTVNHVVQALRESEELDRAFDDGPTYIDPYLAQQADLSG